MSAQGSRGSQVFPPKLVSIYLAVNRSQRKRDKTLTSMDRTILRFKKGQSQQD